MAKEWSYPLESIILLSGVRVTSFDHFKLLSITPSVTKFYTKDCFEKDSFYEKKFTELEDWVNEFKNTRIQQKMVTKDKLSCWTIEEIQNAVATKLENSSETLYFETRAYVAEILRKDLFYPSCQVCFHRVIQVDFSKEYLYISKKIRIFKAGDARSAKKR